MFITVITTAGHLPLSEPDRSNPRSLPFHAFKATDTYNDIFFRKVGGHRY